MVLAALAATGRLALFAGRTLGHLLTPPFYLREFLHACLQIGWLSLPVVGLTAIFTGAALALQIYAGGARFSAEAVVPQIVAIGMTRRRCFLWTHPTRRGASGRVPGCIPITRSIMSGCLPSWRR
ncbi:hypothetical protein EOM89_07570 [Candidatus Falkowbacteria bacterium]|nr:hypothetical protein [Candidatus Falkowbacteria bacterium]